ncbi:unnamed protein product [Arabidopsis arenosa]|uniref:Transposase-associated domain-containing protein n=1 Tax=Arabidopsis arenosa TaxID=38785 RepID=A0A8S1ZKH8_ARAAE|nr:unnamed protein product [Arabidopsis arenosa]
MLDKRWVHLCRVDPAYESGAWKFVRAVSDALGDGDMIVCPCIDCRNVDRHSESVVVDHLVTRGMDEAYKLRADWYHHGEVNSRTEFEKRGDAEVGENSAPRSVNKRGHPNCNLIDWDGTDDVVGEGRLLSSDSEDLVNGVRLGPYCVKVLVETARVPDAFLFRPAPNMFSMDQAVGELIAWPASNCVVTDVDVDQEDIVPKSPSTNSANKCKLMDWNGDEKVLVAEGRWQTQERKALVNGLPLGPNAVKVFVDVVHRPETFLWRPTAELQTIEDCLKSFVAWPARRVVFGTTSEGDATTSRSPVATPQRETVSSQLEKSATTPSPPVKKAKSASESPVVRRSPRKKANQVSMENQRCKLMAITGKKQVVAEGRWSSNNPDQVVHFVPLGPKGVRVWVDVVKVKDAAVWRPDDEIEVMEDAIGSSIAWPEDKVVLF